MRADCMITHDRVSMEKDHLRNLWVCLKCGETLRIDEIISRTPKEYRSSSDPFISTIQNLMDYEIVGVLKPGLVIDIEYERPSISNA